MAEGEALKRLGGGRWKTADDRFTIEPQSGSWVVVDAMQTDDLGLALVRGPFRSLSAAREAIEAARSGDVPVSPLAARVEEERRHPRPSKPALVKGRKRTNAPLRAGVEPVPKPVTPARPKLPKPPEPPPPPPEPAWIGELPRSRRALARQLIERLTDAGIPEAEAVARAEIAGGEPAVARAALLRRLQDVTEGRADRGALVAEILGILASGEDPELQVRWRLVDGDGRPLAPLTAVGDGSSVA